MKKLILGMTSILCITAIAITGLFAAHSIVLAIFSLFAVTAIVITISCLSGE